MKFKTTESAPVRYEAEPNTWVEYARPHELKHGEVAVYERVEEIPIWASIENHAGGGCYAVELVVGGEGEHEFEESVFARRIRDYPAVKALLLAELARLGVDTRDEEAPAPPRRSRRRVEPEVRTARDEGCVRMVGYDFSENAFRVHPGDLALRSGPSGDEPRRPGR